MWPLLLLIIGIGGGGCALNTTGLYVPPDGSDDTDAVGDDVPPDAYDVEGADAEVDGYDPADADADDVYVGDEGEDSGHCIGNLPPRSFHLLSPAPDETNVSTRTIFEWGSAIDPEGGDIKYTLTYDDDGNPATPSRVVSDLTGTSYTLSPSDALPFGALVAWSVTATDDCGNVTEGISPRSFTTREYPICAKIGSDVRVTNAGGDSMYPALVWTGGGYGVSWQDNRDGNYEIYFKTISSGGVPSSSETRVTNSAGDSEWPSIAWGGMGYAVSWDDNQSGDKEIYFQRISTSGSLIGSQIAITDNTTDSRSPTIVWNGSEYALCWHDNIYSSSYEIFFGRVSSSGSIIGSIVRETNTPGYSKFPSLVWNGSGYALSWHDYTDSNYDIYFRLLSSEGDVISSDARLTNNPGNTVSPVIAWTGSEYGVSWYDNVDGNNEIYFAIISDVGAIIATNIRLTDNSGTSMWPSISWDGAHYAVVWHDDSYENQEIYFQLLSTRGESIGENLRVTNAPGDSGFPSLVWNGREFAIAWNDSRDGNNEIYFARLSCEP